MSKISGGYIIMCDHLSPENWEKTHQTMTLEDEVLTLNGYDMGFYVKFLGSNL